jgi:hypothetical protein
MRKVDPTGLCLDLIQEIRELRQFYIDATEALNDKAQAAK